VRVHFATPRPARGPRWPSERPRERLVYLLDHEYTQNGLAWGHLKNGDAARAALLREVADRLDCEIVLALSDVHESWSCENDWGHEGFGYGRRTRRSRASSDPPDPASREPVHIGVDEDQGAVHARSSRARIWTRDLVWLTQTAGSFGATRRPAITAPADRVKARPRRGVRTRR
jgi:hypothetical protein